MISQQKHIWKHLQYVYWVIIAHKKTLHLIDYFIDDIPHSFMTVASGKWHLIETVCSTVVSEEQIVEHSLKTLWVAISNTLGSSTEPELTAS